MKGKGEEELWSLPSSPGSFTPHSSSCQIFPDCQVRSVGDTITGFTAMHCMQFFVLPSPFQSSSLSWERNSEEDVRQAHQTDQKPLDRGLQLPASSTQQFGSDTEMLRACRCCAHTTGKGVSGKSNRAAKTFKHDLCSSETAESLILKAKSTEDLLAAELPRV